MPQYWAGIVDGKIDTLETDTGWGGWGQTKYRAPAFFTSRTEARARYEEVRKVEVLVVSKKK